eukprot:1149014-Pelagomonas_calceolata.AAC.4
MSPSCSNLKRNVVVLARTLRIVSEAMQRKRDYICQDQPIAYNEEVGNVSEFWHSKRRSTLTAMLCEQASGRSKKLRQRNKWGGAHAQ